MRATKKNIRNADSTIFGLEDVVRSLGYLSTEDFLEDNPGAVEVIFDWLCEDGLMRDGTQIPDDDDDDDDDEDDKDAEEMIRIQHIRDFKD